VFDYRDPGTGRNKRDRISAKKVKGRDWSRHHLFFKKKGWREINKLKRLV